MNMYLVVNDIYIEGTVQYIQQPHKPQNEARPLTYHLRADGYLN